MKKYLQKIDNFGAEFRPLINTETQHKSTIGGIFTLIVYGTSFAYFIFILSQWYMRMILPKTMSQLQTTDFQICELPNDLIQLAYVRYNDSLSDPFSQQENILMPIAVVMENDIPISKTSILSNTHHLSMYNTVLIEMDGIRIVKNAKNNKTMESDQYFSLVITTCKEKYLQGNQTCASSEKITEFFDRGLASLQFDVTLQQFNSKSKVLTDVTKQLQFRLQPESTIKIDLIFQNSNIVIDDHPIFSNAKQLNFFQDFSVITQTMQSNMAKALIKDSALLQIVLKVDPIEISHNVTYVKLGEILADVGSISSLLLTVSWFIMQFNKEELDNMLIDEIISIYYPQFKDLKKKKNCMGKTIEIIHEQNKLNKEEFDKWYASVREKTIQKLSVINQLNEIARMYFIIRQQLNLQSLMKLQKYGISLPQKLFYKHVTDDVNNELPTPPFKDIENIEVESCKMISSEMGLCEDDFNALSYSQKPS